MKNLIKTSTILLIILSYFHAMPALSFTDTIAMNDRGASDQNGGQSSSRPDRLRVKFRDRR
jgi:hypothetical protein